jgi:8-oxo-dGTP pyrophosphatase MutT (NUDIX family)
MNNDVALIKRSREQRRYYLFPGGGVESGETPEEAAIREVLEELGVRVALTRLAAIARYGENLQLYYTGTVISGIFGTGTGEELSSTPESEAGSYEPVWIPISELGSYDIRPKVLAQSLREGLLGGGRLPLWIDE